MRLWLHTIGILVVCGCTSLAALRVASLARDIDVSVRMTDTLQEQAHDTLSNLQQASAKLAQTTGAVNAMAKAELTQVAASTDELHKTERAVRANVDSLRQVFIDLHQETLPKANLALADLDARIIEAKAPIEHADALLADPSILATLASSADAMKQVDASAVDVRQIADKARETYLKPAKLWLVAIEKLLGLGPPLVTAIK